VRSLVGKRPVQPEDFDDGKVLSKFVKNCLRFQERTLSETMATHDSRKYMPQVPDEQLKPYALVSPYFYMTETRYKKWLPIFVDAIKIAQDEYQGVKLFASLVLSQVS